MYRKEADQSFVQHQRLAATGAADVTHLTVGGAHYLALAGNRQDVISSPQTSRLYRWDPATRRFLLHQDLSTTRVAAVRALTLRDGTGERRGWVGVWVGVWWSGWGWRVVAGCGGGGGGAGWV